MVENYLRNMMMMMSQQVFTVSTLLYAETPRKQSGSAWFPHPIPSQQHSSTHLPHLGDATKAAGPMKKTNMRAKD
jgi:hypothetical protein